LDLARPETSLEAVDILDNDSIFRISSRGGGDGFLVGGVLLPVFVFDFFHEDCSTTISRLGTGQENAAFKGPFDRLRTPSLSLILTVSPTDQYLFGVSDPLE
jgi:hypothetical protein